MGKEGLNKTLTASQVVLSVILPFVSAPLVYFTCRNRYMTVPMERVHDADADIDTDEQTQPQNAAEGDDNGGSATDGVKMGNGLLVSAIAVLVWVIIAVMNVALLVLVGMGKA